MYQLSIKEEFVAQHYLTVPDCGPENIKHSHIYAVEVILEGGRLNKYGYLVDIDNVKSSMADVIGRYRDKTLNDSPAFEGLNPSIEHFSRIVVNHLQEDMDCTNVEKISVKIWEDRHCWSSYSISIDL